MEHKFAYKRQNTSQTQGLFAFRWNSLCDRWEQHSMIMSESYPQPPPSPHTHTHTHRHNCCWAPEHEDADDVHIHGWPWESRGFKNVSDTSGNSKPDDLDNSTNASHEEKSHNWIASNKTLSHVFLKTHSPSLALGYIQHAHTHPSPFDETHLWPHSLLMYSQARWHHFLSAAWQAPHQCSCSGLERAVEGKTIMIIIIPSHVMNKTQGPQYITAGPGSCQTAR